MSYLIWLPLGVELKAKCYSDSLSRMAKDKKSFAKPSSRNTSNAGGHSPSRSRRSDENASHSRYNRFSNSGSSGCNDLNSGGRSSAVPVRHIPCIRPPRELIVEIYLFIYLLFCLVLQNLNIYKQNWYLIDYDLLVFSVIVLGRTVLWRVLTWLGRWWCHAQNYKYWIGKGVELTGKLGIVVMAVHLASELLFSYSLPCCLYLAYPVFLYTSLFGFTLDPHQERLRLYRSYPSSPQCLRVAEHSSYRFDPQSTLSDTRTLSDSNTKSPRNNSAVLPDTPSPLGSQSEYLRLRHPAQYSAGSGSGSSEAAKPHPAQSSPDSRRTSPSATGVPVQSMGLCNSAFASPPRSGAQVLTSSLITRSLAPWRSLSPEAMVVVSTCPSVSLSANSTTAHPLVPSPDWVRQEVECLWADYLVRAKQIFFSSILCAYYAGFLPMQMVKHDQLYFQHLWCWVHTGVILCNSFLLLSFLLLPAHYCGSLYKCAVQLGFWEVQVGQTTAPHTWSAMSSWPRGSVVRHPRGVFRASGSHATVAIPGDEGHGSFYLLFTWALYIPIWCCMFGLALLLLQIYCLWKFTDYLQSFSIFVSLVFSLYPYFHLARDSLILSKTALKS